MNTFQKEQSSEDIEGAASRIQAGYHGYKTRTQFLPQGERTKVYSLCCILLHAFRLKTVSLERIVFVKMNCDK